MPKVSNRELGMGREIARRDFLQGVAIGVSLGGLAPELASAAEAEAQNSPGYYPPIRLGMRGSHPGSFEAAHELRDGDFWNHASSLIDTGETYDLVVVGGGISGLSAAYFYRAARPRSKILIIENHDDFGGHAKRNEFHVNGRMGLINGGTLEISSPYPYSAAAGGLLRSLGIEPTKLAKACDDPSIYAELKSGVFFDRETFGVDRLVKLDTDENGKAKPDAWRSFVAQAPVSSAAKRAILKIETGTGDYYSGLSGDQKKDRLWRISYKDYLLDVVKADPAVVPFYQHHTDEWWGCGIDAVSALDCWGMGYPGFAGLRLEPGGPSLKRMGYTPAGYSTTGGSERFHFPDGNASIARLLVRALNPEAMPGKDARDVVTARADYSKLDRPGNNVRIRLNNLVVRARNAGTAVEIAYTASRGGGSVYRVRARDCVLANWNAMIPYLVPELPEAQKAALHDLVKCPLVYTNVALRDWAAFHRLGLRRVHAPGSYHISIALNPAVNIGSYRSVRSPDGPMLIRMARAPASPGLSEYDQNRAGRMELLQTSFETFERNIRDQLARTLGGTGFDPARDIEGIAVNRWPHGYAPEYNSLWDKGFDTGHTPNLIARQRFGRIAIANSDAGFAAYTDSAIDQAHRAVGELVTS
ncbi:MAG TPA: FAD-dependent oxidoreductase [Rhizomicrobium sp.]|jgi:spermidine dehydrogenase|nr:FAD-dependent oxidoreductase [Rhizomicrobium sp.]